MRLAVMGLGALFGVSSALAQGAPPSESMGGASLQSIASSLPNNGDPGGLRKWLSEHGLTYSFDYTADILSNLSGGLRRGTAYMGRLEGIVDIDLEKMAGFNGLSFHANGFQISGTGISRDYVGNFETISNIEALSKTRLSEVWFEQKLFGDKVTVRIGQLAADQEFFISDFSIFFLDSGWPQSFKMDLPAGGAAYPFATPGVRVKVTPMTGWTFLAALLDGNPAGPGVGSPEERNRYGLNFRVQDAPFLIAETQYRLNGGATDTGLATTIRVGGWHHFGSFDDQRFGTDGLSLANPASNGVPRKLRGNDAIYGIIDQQLYRPAGAAPDGGIGIFSQASLSPSDRNIVNFFFDGGIVFTGMLPHRPDDKFGATFLYSSISSRAAALDADRIIYTGMIQPVRDYELTVELAYMWQIIPGWTIQPDFQYIFHPGGNIPDPNATPLLVPIKDAAVFGVRTYIRY